MYRTGSLQFQVVFTMLFCIPAFIEAFLVAAPTIEFMPTTSKHLKPLMSLSSAAVCWRTLPFSQNSSRRKRTSGQSTTFVSRFPRMISAGGVVLNYQNYQGYENHQPFVFVEQEDEISHPPRCPLTTKQTWSSSSSAPTSPSPSSSPEMTVEGERTHDFLQSSQRNDHFQNIYSIPTSNVPSIDLPRSVFDRLTEMEYKKERDSLLDLEILSGRAAIFLCLYFYSIEILTGEGVLDQVSHFVS